MKVKTITIISVIFILLLTLSFTAFSRGRGTNLLKIELDSNTYKKVEPSITNLYNSIKNLIEKEVSAGIMTKYYSDTLLKDLDNAYEKIKKTKVIYLPLFGGMGPKGPNWQNQSQGPQNNQGGPMGNQQGGPMGYGQNQFSQQQLDAAKKLIPEITKVIDAELDFGKALKDAGIITDLQFAAYSTRIDRIKQAVNQFPLLHYGLMQFFMIAGYEPNN